MTLRLAEQFSFAVLFAAFLKWVIPDYIAHSSII